MDTGIFSATPRVRARAARLLPIAIAALLAEVYDALGEQGAAQRLYDRLLPYAELNAVTPSFEYLGAVAHYLGILARLLTRPADATRHLDAAKKINERLHMPLQLAWTQALLSATVAAGD